MGNGTSKENGESEDVNISGYKLPSATLNPSKSKADSKTKSSRTFESMHEHIMQIPDKLARLSTVHKLDPINNTTCLRDDATSLQGLFEKRFDEATGKIKKPTPLSSYPTKLHALDKSDPDNINKTLKNRFLQDVQFKQQVISSPRFKLDKNKDEILERNTPASLGLALKYLEKWHLEISWGEISEEKWKYMKEIILDDLSRDLSPSSTSTIGAVFITSTGSAPSAENNPHRMGLIFESISEPEQTPEHPDTDERPAGANADARLVGPTELIKDPVRVHAINEPTTNPSKP